MPFEQHEERNYALEGQPGGCGRLPLDAVERKLMFGVRMGVVQTVVSWFFAHLENNLGLTGK